MTHNATRKDALKKVLAVSFQYFSQNKANQTMLITVKITFPLPVCENLLNFRTLTLSLVFKCYFHQPGQALRDCLESVLTS